MGQVLKAAEKPIELQTNTFQGQSFRKEKAQPNKSYPQTAIGKRKDSEHQFAGKASSAKHKKSKQQRTFKKG